MKKETAEKILSQTEMGYDLISGKFSQTRKHFWRELEFMKEYVKDGDEVLDFGCGNGRLLELIGNKKISYVGTDIAQGLLDVAQEKYKKDDVFFVKSDPLSVRLKFSEESFNVTYSIAVFHHFPSKEYRQKVAEELFRITKKDGHIIVTAWNLFQKKYFKNIFKNWFDKVVGRSELDWNDCYISFSDNGKNRIERFHHAFTKRELSKLFEKAGFKTQRSEVIGGRNILYVGKK